MPQDAAASYLATFSHADLDVPGPRARGPIVDAKPPPAWLEELPPSPLASLYHDDVFVVHGGADVLPSAAVAVPAGTAGDVTSVSAAGAVTAASTADAVTSVSAVAVSAAGGAALQRADGVALQRTGGVVLMGGEDAPLVHNAAGGVTSASADGGVASATDSASYTALARKPHLWCASALPATLLASKPYLWPR
jgi:hypothetical protein